MELENTEILTIEAQWFERGVKEAIYIKALNPSLNKDVGAGGRLQFATTMGQYHQAESQGREADGMGAWWVRSSSSSCTMSPTASSRRQN